MKHHPILAKLHAARQNISANPEAHELILEVMALARARENTIGGIAARLGIPVAGDATADQLRSDILAKADELRSLEKTEPKGVDRVTAEERMQYHLDFRARVRKSVGVYDFSMEDEEVFRILAIHKSDRKDALEQIANLGAFIGHPGATPAHVVSEAVSLIEKFADAAARTGILMEDRPMSMVAEDAVAKSKRAKPFMESLLAAGRAMGIEFKEDGDGSRILEAIRQKYNEAADRANRELNARVESAKHWQASRDEWKKRALAAEARVEEEMERGKSWCSESITQRKRAEAAEARLPVEEAPKTFDDLNQEIRKTFFPTGDSPAQAEVKRLKGIRDDETEGVEKRRKAAIAVQTYTWFFGSEPAAIPPSSCLQANLPMLKEDEAVFGSIRDSEKELITVRPGCGFSGRNRSMVFRIREDGSVEIER